VPYATFIESKSGTIQETPISKSDISTFGQICDANIYSSSEDIVKLVYLRRYYETLNNKGMVYQLLSNLLHKRDAPYKKESDQQIPLTPDEFSEATEEIRKKMPDFDYYALLTKLSDVDYMKTAYRTAGSNYEKIQIFRVLQDHFPESDIINKFINGTFHIENEYVMQLNPCKYEIVPSFIIDECDKLIFPAERNEI